MGIESLAAKPALGLANSRLLLAAFAALLLISQLAAPAFAAEPAPESDRPGSETGDAGQSQPETGADPDDEAEGPPRRGRDSGDSIAKTIRGELSFFYVGALLGRNLANDRSGGVLNLRLGYAIFGTFGLEAGYLQFSGSSDSPGQPRDQYSGLHLGPLLNLGLGSRHHNFVIAPNLFIASGGVGLLMRLGYNYVADNGFTIGFHLYPLTDFSVFDIHAGVNIGWRI